jgi:hypothetical protein
MSGRAMPVWAVLLAWLRNRWGTTTAAIQLFSSLGWCPHKVSTTGIMVPSAVL